MATLTRKFRFSIASAFSYVHENWELIGSGVVFVLLLLARMFFQKDLPPWLDDTRIATGATLVGSIWVFLYLHGIKKKVGVSIEYHDGHGFASLYQHATSLIAQSRRSIYILNRWPDDRPNAQHVADIYYQRLEDFARSDDHRLLRVMQVPTFGQPASALSDEQLSRLFHTAYGNEHPLTDHLGRLVELRESGRNVLLGVSTIQRNSTFIIFDEKTVLWCIYQGDPFKRARDFCNALDGASVVGPPSDDEQMQLVGIFIIRDPGGHLIRGFLNVFFSALKDQRPISANAIAPWSLSAPHGAAAVLTPQPQSNVPTPPLTASLLGAPVTPPPGAPPP